MPRLTALLIYALLRPRAIGNCAFSATSNGIFLYGASMNRPDEKEKAALACPSGGLIYISSGVAEAILEDGASSRI